MRHIVKIEEESGLKDYLVNHFSFSFFGYLRHINATITRNGSKVTYNTLVHPEDMIEINYSPIKQEGALSNKPFVIVYEDEYCIVVNKDSFLPTTPSHMHPTDSVYNRLLYYFRDKEYTIHFISRLDKDTSGLILIAKDQLSACLFNDNQKKNIKKYIADTYQEIIPSSGVIEKPIGRDHDNIRDIKENGHYAKTEYSFIGMQNNYYRYDILLRTGRCHQIRVHFKSVGASIVNDVLYSQNSITNEPMHLCAYYLKFYHPFKNEWIELSIEPKF